jgi:hypothetical protein
MDSFHLYLENQKLNINNYTNYEKILIQGFYYGICAALSNNDQDHSVENILKYAGDDFIQHYRDYGGRFHEDFQRLASAIPADFPQTAQENTTAEFETWFFRNMREGVEPTVFTTLADGNNVEEGVWTTPAKPKAKSNLTNIRKTYRRRRSRALSPPRKIKGI